MNVNRESVPRGAWRRWAAYAALVFLCLTAGYEGNVQQPNLAYARFVPNGMACYGVGPAELVTTTLRRRKTNLIVGTFQRVIRAGENDLFIARFIRHETLRGDIAGRHVDISIYKAWNGVGFTPGKRYVLAVEQDKWTEGVEYVAELLFVEVGEGDKITHAAYAEFEWPEYARAFETLEELREFIGQ